MKQYRTEYPNQLHQLIVNVSKNLYVTKSGILKYQKKKMEVNLNSLKESKRTHLIHYLIRDHTSSLFYAEISTSEEVNNIGDFLYRAWSHKNDFSFQGIPEFLSIPKTIQAYYPDILKELEPYEIDVVEPTSGFHGGIGDTKNIEDILTFFHLEKHISGAYNVPQRACETNDKRKLRGTKFTKLEQWQKYVGQIRLPNSSQQNLNSHYE